MRAALAGAVITAIAVGGTGGVSRAAPEEGNVAIIQAVPKASLSVAVDGREVKQDMAEGAIVGPLSLPPGPHEVTFGDGADETASTFEVKAGKTTDVVLHRPAEVGGTPVVSVYPSPTGPLGPGKARVLLAHTATTAPADVQVDGQIVFTNIANGEFAQADVPAGSHEVALFPSGLTADAILGPLDVTLEPGTLTSVYAVGNPVDGSMKVIVRTSTVGADDTPSAPGQIDTGSAGLLGDARVWTFSAAR